MKHSEFKIGSYFSTNRGRVGWLCTDIGTRTVIAILCTDDKDWMKGPPYAMNETVFDEYDLEDCVPGFLGKGWEVKG